MDSTEPHALFYVTPGGSIVAATVATGAGITVVKRTEVATRLAMDLNTQNVNWDLFPDDKSLVIDQSGQGRRRMVLIQNWPAIARSLGESAKR